MKNHTNRLVKGALLLSLAGLLSKVLSAGYRVPLQNLTGDFGFYIYQQVYPILGIIFTLSIYGLPSAVSKLTVEIRKEGKGLSLMGFYFPVLCIIFVISSMFFVILFLLAKPLASMVGDVDLTLSYETAAFVFLFLPFTALLRGAFQGRGEMKPTAYSQVAEQLVRVIIIIMIAYIFTLGKMPPYYIGVGASIAAMVGACTALIVLMFFFIRNRRQVIEQENIQPPWGLYIRTIVSLGVVASLNHMVLLIIQFADVFTFIPGLMANGFTQSEAMELKGVFDRGQPLIQLGTVLGSSFALAMIPAVAVEKKNRQKESLQGSIKSALSLSIYIAIGATIGLIIIFPEANHLLFQNGKGTFSLQILSISILLSSLAITITSILQGFGYYKRTALFIFIAFFIKWILNQLLLPYIGITGGALATVISIFVLCLLTWWELKRKFPHVSMYKQLKIKALMIASFGMMSFLIVIRFIMPYTLFSSRLSLLLYVILLSFLGGLLYVLLLIKMKAFTKKELVMLPFASFFLNIYEGRER